MIGVTDWKRDTCIDGLKVESTARLKGYSETQIWGSDRDCRKQGTKVKIDRSNSTNGPISA